ncbi:uncharacterized protein LOC127873560 [Dreissena polymorpha]|uniref:uncharacterized protein LOC127873560 n=1 Tax=Dreissena polymorpha TaxID=45954 RepID=UPI0022652517|nr:uncharacterized protein LOC127873560 [Dreissena polymorpha]
MTCTEKRWTTIGECLEYSRPLSVQDIRLANGSKSTSGRVEIKVLDTWGTVCSDSFGKEEADVICRMMGYPPAKAFQTSLHEGTGPIFIDNMVCGVNNSNINECHYDTFDNCNHSKDMVVTCTDCGDPTVSFGEVNHTSSSVGSVVSVVCEYGRKLVGDSVIVCQENGNWTNTPFCSLIDCGNPTPINGATNGTSHYLDAVLHVSCKTGFALSGNSIIRCQSNSTWTDYPVCTVVDCKELNIVNMTIDVGNKTTYGQIALVSCKPDFTPRGSWTVRCEASGVWNYTHVPQCELIHCGVAAISNGSVNDTTSTVGTVVHVECNYGRQLIGDSLRVCQLNGEWTGSPSCILIECDDPSPDNGIVNGTSRFLDDVLSVSCNTGFTLTGNSVIHCQSDRTWSDNPNCIIVDCDLLLISNMIINIANVTTYGHMAEVRCKPDFTPLGVWTVKCEASGVWNQTHVPKCELIDCGDPTPIKGLVNSSVTSVNTVVSVSCENGYIMSGDSVITCLRNGLWSGNPICYPSDCGRPAIPNANVTISTSTSLNSTAVISCDVGFNLKGPSVITCTTTGWSDNVTCSQIDCGKMDVSKGRVIGTDTNYGAVIEVECSTGYFIQGDNKLTCQGKGQWSDNPICVIQNCTNVTIPTNGIILTSPILTTFNSSLRFQCEHGYQLNGNDILWCDATGKWNSSVQTCIRKYCDDPTPANGVINGTSYYYNDVVSVSCNNGYSLSGEHIIQCQSNSNWTSYPTCNIIVCEQIDLTNGKVTGASTKFASVIEVQCHTGYDLNGDDRLVCQANGQWSGKPTCVIKNCGNITVPSKGMLHGSTMVTTYNSLLRFRCEEGYLLKGNDVMWCAATGAWNSSVPICIRKSNIGGLCTDASMCGTINAICENKICACMSGVEDKHSGTCDIMPILPFGQEAGDTSLGHDLCSEQIVFEPTIPVFDKMRRLMHVCRRGFISFDTKYLSEKPKMASDGKANINFPVVAAYFTEIYLDHLSTITYRTYDVLKNYPFTPKVAGELELLESVIKRVENMSAFDTSFVLIATWSNVRPSFNPYNATTFQLIIISSGEQTFSFSTYGHNLMKWNSERERIPLWIGHADTDREIYRYIYSFSKNALKWDLLPKTGGIRGLLLKNVNNNKTTVSNDALDCIKWYNRNLYLKQNIHVYSQRLPTCPCDVGLAQWDPWFWQIRRQVRLPDSKDVVCVDMILRESYKPYGKSCCYYRSSLTFVEMQPLSGGFYFSHPSFSPRDHEVNDVIMKDKCCTKSDYCNLYYELHPTGTCYTESPFNFGSFWGDPHMRTLDGMNYTFNGLGEYVLLSIQTSNVTFSLQARTERAKKADGNISDATIFTAFAARDHTNSSLHIELNTAKDDLILYGNEIDLTKTLKDFGNDRFAFNSPTMSIYGVDGVLRVSFLETGIMLEIGKEARMLSLDTIVPKTFNNVTKGLLGNFDGDPFNDFVYPNGSLLHFNASDLEIFRFGQTWSVNDSSSVFIYEDGKSHSDYHNASYVPRFLDTFDKETIIKAEKICGSVNVECVFDYVFTLNSTIAKTTSNISETININAKEIAKVVPTINNTCSVNATVGEHISCQLNLADELDIAFVKNESNRTTYNRTSKTLYFKQTDYLPHNIWFVAVNADGKQSQQHIVTVQLCTGCHGNGHCSTTVRQDPRENAYFKYSSCVCNAGYTGADCDKTLDWCAGSPCTLGRNCTNVPQNNTYSCYPCPAGYASVPNTNDCIDNDECSSRPCNQLCINTEGSYSCGCKEGYRVDPSNEHTCIDINECNEATHNCTQICDNTIGGFLCKCQPGFTFNVSNFTCSRDDSDPCAASTLDCSRTSGCTLDVGNNTLCFCDAGLWLNETSLGCQDVDECSQHICAQDCMNTIGSFQCSCIAGYQLVDKVSCKPCEVPNWGTNCGQTCACSGRGAER